MDDTQVSFFGLDEAFAELYAQGQEASDATAEEIIKKLEDYKNYIPSSEKAHRDYCYLLLKEYRKYIKEQKEKAGAKG